MTETTWVWIPSLQRYYRFRLITSRQQKVISFHLQNQDDFEFCKITAELIDENIAEEASIPTRSWTILDKFFVLLQLRINSMGSILATTVKEIDLTEFLKNVSEFVDHHFTYKITHKNTTYYCNLPTIQNELELYGIRKSTGNEDELITKMLYEEKTWGYISALEINGQEISLLSLPITDRFKILNEIPSIVLERIKKEFIKPLDKVIEYEGFLHFNDQKIDFNLFNSFHIMKFFLSYTLSVIHEEYFFLQKHGYDANHIDNSPAGDRMIFIKLVKKSIEDSTSNPGDEATRQLIHA